MSMHTSNTTTPGHPQCSDNSHWVESNGYGGFAVYCSLGAAREHVATFHHEHRAQQYCKSMTRPNINAELLGVLKNTLNELEHWHGWQLSTNAAYPNSDGARVCQGRIDRARQAIARVEGE